MSMFFHLRNVCRRVKLRRYFRKILMAINGFVMIRYEDTNNLRVKNVSSNQITYISTTLLLSNVSSVFENCQTVHNLSIFYILRHLSIERLLVAVNALLKTMHALSP
jgi:hypothetical protein